MAHLALQMNDALSASQRPLEKCRSYLLVMVPCSDWIISLYNSFGTSCIRGISRFVGVATCWTPLPPLLSSFTKTMNSGVRCRSGMVITQCTSLPIQKAMYGRSQIDSLWCPDKKNGPEFTQLNRVHGRSGGSTLFWFWLRPYPNRIFWRIF